MLRACVCSPFLDICRAGSFVSKMMNGKGFDVINFESVLEDANTQGVFRKQPQVCLAGKELIDALTPCD